MTLGFLVTLETRTNKQTHRQDSCFISIDIIKRHPIKFIYTFCVHWYIWWESHRNNLSFLLLPDINECLQEPDICVNGVCENIQNGYRCICNTGYKADPTGLRCLGEWRWSRLIYYEYCLSKLIYKHFYFFNYVHFEKIKIW